ncbi:MAG: UPF0158 family protein [Candidatus Cloacimonetes bacterium]|nr:UPF0158 family protein [Candidatus Cloacimonadota bacterium]
MKYSDKLIDEIIIALDNADYEIRYYFNKEDKAVKFFAEFDDDEFRDEEYDLDLSKWIEIDGIASYTKFNLMENFGSNQNENLRNRLYTALHNKGPFRRFRDVLYRFPEEQKQWYDFEHNWFKEKAIDFLDLIYDN